MEPRIETLPWHHQRHHRAAGFQNLDEHERPVSVWKGATWAARRLLYTKAHAPPPVHRPEPAALRRPPRAALGERLRLTWFGHSTMLVQTPTYTLLTDPIFADRASPVPFAGPQRFTPPPLEIRALPAPDAVLLSHDHYDHCDQAALKELHHRYAPTFFVPLGVARRLRGWGLDGPIVEMDWWQRAAVPLESGAGAVRMTCLPASHFSGRSLFDRNTTLWASWMVEMPAPPHGAPSANSHAANSHAANGYAANGSSSSGECADGEWGEHVRFYYGGDTGYTGHFSQIRERLGAPEVAVLPIGAFRPRWLMAPVHMGPAQALQAVEDLGAARVVPVHWGTFDLAEETVQEPAELLTKIAARRGLTAHVRIPDIGEALTFGEHAERPARAGRRFPES